MPSTTKSLYLTAIGLLCAALAIGGCGSGANGAPDPEAAGSAADGTQVAAPAQPETAPAAQLANPASVNCEKQGGKLEIRTEAAGQFGVCVFADGTRCEEWRLFRGECKPGACTDPDGRCQAKPE
jgi:hypothetical protein